MQSRWPLHVLLASSTLILLSEARDVTGSGGLSCLRSSPAEDGHTLVTFLREDPSSHARSLYLSRWNSRDMRLVACQVNTDQRVTESYRAICDRRVSRGHHGDTRQRFNISALLAPDAPCALGSHIGAPESVTRSSRRDGTESRTRIKRSWIFPGTLWCGTGSRAIEYEQLGMFESADRCCREHDHCLHIIPALTMKYGVFNRNFYSVSHCDCDQRFRQCLLGVNDTISKMVGYSFFNILKVPCFELKHQKRCTQMYWWGTCKQAKNGPNAIFKSTLPYNTSDVMRKYVDDTDGSKIPVSEELNVTESPMMGRKSPKAGHRCRSRDTPRGDNFHGRGTKGKGCQRHRGRHSVGPSEIPPLSSQNATTASIKKGILKESNSHLISNKKGFGKEKSTRKGLSAYTTQRNLGQKKLSHVPTVAPPTTTYMVPLNFTTHVAHRKKKTKGTPEQDTLKTKWSTATSATPLTTKLKAGASLSKYSRPQTQINPHLSWNKTSQEPIGTTKAQNTHAGRGPTEDQPRCWSLKHLDNCKYKIPPSEKKYDMQNMEPKTTYHCDCTSRLAAQIKSSKQPLTLPTLLMDFVSQYCFQLPKKKKCTSRKSCSGDFTKASDLLQALKKMEEKDTAGVQHSHSERKRGIPVSFYKRCLRLEREADIRAQLTD